MIPFKIQENKIKANNALKIFERKYNIAYKTYKTFGGNGYFESELRKIKESLVDLQNSFNSHVQSIAIFSRNVDLLRLIDSGYFNRFSEAMSVDSLFRIASFNNFQMPETSLTAISQNDNIINEIQAITTEISNYNAKVNSFRQKRNKYFVTLYKIPNYEKLPNLIEGVINIQHLFPNEEILSAIARERNLRANNLRFEINENPTNRRFRING